MNNHVTVSAITANLRSALEKEGIRFTMKAYAAERDIPASLFPLGRISYLGETFDDGFGERPSYAEADYLVRVTVSESDMEAASTELQKWIHLIRSTLTAAALNSGVGLTNAPVSSVRIRRADIDGRGALTTAELKVSVKYRES